MSQKKTILVVDDDEIVLQVMNDLLEYKTMKVVTAKDGDEGLELFKKHQPKIVFLDFNMPKMNGIEVMEKILEMDPSVSVVIFTGGATVNTAVEAMKKGAYDYVTKPMSFTKISLLIDRIINSQTLMEEYQLLQAKLDQLFGFKNFVGTSAQIRKVYNQIKQVSQTDSTVLLQGESGTGKELVANALHYSGKRKGKPFVKVNCAALPEGIIESELFGHEKGAFTSAITRRIGRFELADGGTLFLDEIGEPPVSTQVKLLRVLEFQEFERLGGNETIKVDVRLITATNRDLEQAVKEKKFREDLYYRLNVINICIAPLRERREDISVLAHHFLEKYASQMNKPITKIAKKAVNILEAYHWPGNVRELANTIERAVVFCKGNTLTERDLPSNIKSAASGLSIALDLPSFSLATSEKLLIEKALAETNWNLKSAAKLLEISRGTLYSKIAKHQIKEE